jgi:hypothetical protein
LTVAAALGGVLFIDEAYSPAAGAAASSGAGTDEREAVDTLVELLEDHRHDLIVVSAGSSAPMEQLLASNEGLASRVPVRVTFDDYDHGQLLASLDSMVAAGSRTATAAARAEVARGLESSRQQPNSGNARTIRNTLAAALRGQAVRLADLGDQAATRRCRQSRRPMSPMPAPAPRPGRAAPIRRRGQPAASSAAARSRMRWALVK